jgi:galactofuranosylgalactofuranosylrhamnosyl-N-acetylglucosaminyl-diphospho-decaprenol beta-1,5/1,6-galactofuranosyltransferase
VTASRTALALAPGERASFGTYFGAFPAAYWFAHTSVRRVYFTLRVVGAVDVELKGTDSAGRVSTLDRAAGDDTVRIEVPISSDTGWLWAEVRAATGAAVIDDVSWATDHDARGPARVTVAITTFDRETDCIRLLTRLADDPESMASIDAVVVADQGRRRLCDAEGFAAAEEALGTRLILVEQANLGGSGGFSRGMIEAVEIGSTHVLLLDDDVDLEPESLGRLARFAEYARNRVIVGAQMLSLVEPTLLHSFGERVSRRGFWWRPVTPELSEFDVAGESISSTPALSRRIEVDFNGWWMCLVPTALVRSVGASLPFFIKWDDAEFGLRAAEHGVTTVTLPGAALWHMPWTAKDDGLDWQAYFQLRNRVVAALLHGSPSVLGSSLAQDVNHVLCAQYGSAAVRNLALADILSGPAHLDPVLRAGPARAAGVLARHGQTVRPKPSASADTRAAATPDIPRGAAASVGRALHVGLHQLRRSDPDATPMELRRSQGKWWALGLADAALVEAAAGTGVFVLRRDRAVALRSIAAALMLRCRLRWSWRRLAREYGRAAGTEASANAWRRRFSDVDA